jgi:hypothetical protein
MFICYYCQTEKKSNKSLLSHVATCPKNENRKIPWNKGLTKQTSEIILRHSFTQTGKKRPNTSGEKNIFYGKRWGSALYGHSIKTKQRLSEIAKERKLGGYVRGSGRGKKGWYKGFFCDSSWELAYVVYCLDHNIDIKRNTEKRQYVWKDKVKNYIPDFIVEGNLIEIKGFKTEQWLAKLEANPDVKVLYEKDLEPVLSYVKNKYGKDFASLYE